MAIDTKFIGRGSITEGVKGILRQLVTAVEAESTFSPLTVTSSTATAVGGAATLNAPSGKVTTAALTTAQDATYTLTLTNSSIAATDKVFVSIANGTNSQGTPLVGRVTPGAGSVVITVINKHATAQALNGTLVVSFLVVS